MISQTTLQGLERVMMFKDIKRKKSNHKKINIEYPKADFRMKMDEFGYCSGRAVFGAGNHTTDCNGGCDFVADVQEHKIGMNISLKESEIL